MNDLFLIVVPSLLTAITTWVFSRRKYSAETQTNELDNVEKAARIWRELSEDLEKRMKDEIRELRSENVTIQDQFTIVLAENKALKEQMSALEKQLKEARCENQKLLEELKRFNKNYNPAP
jgi:septal ring factor EnvC (AmiA/AmiB activator)